VQACADAAAERIAFLEEQVTVLMTDLEATSSQAVEAIEAAQDQAAALLAAAAADKEAALAEAAAHLASSQVHSKIPPCNAVIQSFTHQMSLMHILACPSSLKRSLLSCKMRSRSLFRKHKVIKRGFRLQKQAFMVPDLTGPKRTIACIQDASKAADQRAAEAQEEVARIRKEAEETASAEAERMRKLLASSAQEKAELEAKVVRAAGALKAADDLRDAK